MKKLLFVAALLCCQMMSAADALTKSDTLWMNDEYEKVKANIATVIGIVQEVDEDSNEAVVYCYDRESAQLLSVQRRVASGKGRGLRTGKQVYYDEQGNVQLTKEYALYTDELKGKKRTRCVYETLLNPDGSLAEEVTFEYKKDANKEKTKVHRYYVRQCYYPNGKLQYKETLDEKGCKTVYYNEKGKKDKHPGQTIAPYETMPDYPGGLKKLFNYLSETVKYPPVAKENGIQGRVIVQFTVDKDGTIGDVEVVRSGGDPSLDREAVRVIKAMPKWNPGTRRGKPVRVRYTVPVNFRLQ